MMLLLHLSEAKFYFGRSIMFDEPTVQSRWKYAVYKRAFLLAHIKNSPITAFAAYLIWPTEPTNKPIFFCF